MQLTQSSNLATCHWYTCAQSHLRELSLMEGSCVRVLRSPTRCHPSRDAGNARAMPSCDLDADPSLQNLGGKA